MADGFTILPEFGNSQGANTAILPENNQVLDTYFKVQENKYRDKLFNYKKTQDEIARKAQALDFDTGEVWQQDQPLIMGKIKELIDYTYKNPDSYDAASEKYADFDKRQREINFLINKSKHDKSIYDDWLNKGATDPNFQDDFEAIKGGLDNFKVTDINERNYVPPVPAPTFNPYEAWKSVEGDIGTTMDTKEGQDKGAGNYEYITTESFDPTQRKQAIEAIWDNNIKKTAQHITRDYNALPPDSPEKQQFPTARDYGIYILDKTYPTVKDTKSAIKPRKYAPTGGSGTGTQNENTTLDERYKFIKEALTTNKGNLTSLLATGKYNGGAIKNATIVEVSPETTKSFIGGTTFPLTSKDKGNKERMLEIKYEAQDNEGHPITKTVQLPLTGDNDNAVQVINNIMNQSKEGTTGFVTPEALRDKYKSDTDWSGGNKAPTNKYDATIEAGIKAVMDKNPNATREQVIEALKKSGKIK